MEHCSKQTASAATHQQRTGRSPRPGALAGEHVLSAAGAGEAQHAQPACRMGVGQRVEGRHERWVGERRAGAALPAAHRRELRSSALSCVCSTPHAISHLGCAHAVLLSSRPGNHLAKVPASAGRMRGGAGLAGAAAAGTTLPPEAKYSRMAASLLRRPCVQCDQRVSPGSAGTVRLAQRPPSSKGTGAICSWQGRYPLHCAPGAGLSGRLRHLLPLLLGLLLQKLHQAPGTQSKGRRNGMRSGRLRERPLGGTGALIIRNWGRNIPR